MSASLEGGKSSVRGKINELKFGQMSQTHINVTPIWIVTAAKNSKRLPKAAIFFHNLILFLLLLLLFSRSLHRFLIAIELAGQFNRAPPLRNNVI